jgi:hypothetical protein
VTRRRDNFVRATGKNVAQAEQWQAVSVELDHADMSYLLK